MNGTSFPQTLGSCASSVFAAAKLPRPMARLNSLKLTIAPRAQSSATRGTLPAFAARKSGEIPDDLVTSAQTAERQNRARSVLWAADEQNYQDLAKITLPVLVADGRDDVIDPPENARIIAAQIPFAWLAFYEGGHAFLYQSAEKFGGTVNLFLSK